MSARAVSSAMETTDPNRLTCRYQSWPSTVRLTIGFVRIQRSLLRPSCMLTRISPSCQSYHVATVIGKPSGRMQAMTAGLGFLRNSSTFAGSLSGAWFKGQSLTKSLFPLGERAGERGVKQDSRSPSPLGRGAFRATADAVRSLRDGSNQID